MQSPILVPALVLVLWSIVMLAWGASMRFPAIKRANVDMSANRGGRGSDLDGVLPGPAQWPVHNYNHLMEQPTIFYATVFALAIMGAGLGLNLMLAWGYVALRIVHSFWQARVNIVRIRVLIFFASTFVLAALALRALLVAIA